MERKAAGSKRDMTNKRCKLANENLEGRIKKKGKDEAIWHRERIGNLDNPLGLIRHLHKSWVQHFPCTLFTLLNYISSMVTKLFTCSP